MEGKGVVGMVRIEGGKVTCFRGGCRRWVEGDLGPVVTDDDVVGVIGPSHLVRAKHEEDVGGGGGGGGEGGFAGMGGRGGGGRDCLEGR